MSRPTITIGSPHRRDFTPEYVQSLADTLTTDIGVNFVFKPTAGTSIHEQRNAVARTMVGDYLLCVDTDMMWQPEDIRALLELDKDIAGGLYLDPTRPPYACLVFDDYGYITDIPKEPFECNSIGAGFLFIKRRVIDALLVPEFVEKSGLPFDLVLVDKEHLMDGLSVWVPEDLSFCMRARYAGFSVWCHPGVRIGHIKATAHYPETQTGHPQNEVGTTENYTLATS